MATLTLDNAQFRWEGGVRLSLRTDRRVVQTTNLKNNVYTSGATQWVLEGEMLALNDTHRDYIESIVMASYLQGDNFRITLPFELLGNRSRVTNLLSVRTGVPGGSNTITMNNDVQLDSIEPGNRFNITGSNRLFVVNSYDSTTRNLVFYPVADVAVGAGVAVNFSAPTFLGDAVFPDWSFGTIPGNPDFRRVRVRFEEVI